MQRNKLKDLDMLNRMIDFWGNIVLVFLILMIYALDSWERLFKKKPNKYGHEIIELRNKELSKAIQRIAEKYDVSYNVADSISREINEAHKRIRTKKLFDV